MSIWPAETVAPSTTRLPPPEPPSPPHPDNTVVEVVRARTTRDTVRIGRATTTVRPAAIPATRLLLTGSMTSRGFRAQLGVGVEQPVLGRAEHGLDLVSG